MFHGETCPHCAKMRLYLETELIPKYPSVKLHKYEVYYNYDNVKLLEKVEDKLNTAVDAVPFLVIGDKAIIGFSEASTPAEIEKRVKDCLESSCPDSVAAIVNPEVEPTPTPSPDTTPAPTPSDEEKKIINLPIIGEVNALNYSLPVLTVFMGALDGFNPCAMWTLLFLISLLLGFKDRKKMWILGSAFIVASAFVYFLFMAAWLKLILFLGFVIWVRWLIGAIAIGGGSYSIKKFFTNKAGTCEVTGDEKRRATFEKLREIVKNKSLPLALGGIVLLAFAVNLVELICSAGLPAVYTQVLALSDLAGWQYYGYILLYIFFFMLDDLIVFAIAMFTLQLTGISTKYSRASNLIGGALMIAIGLLLIIKPEWLMFG